MRPGVDDERAYFQLLGRARRMLDGVSRAMRLARRTDFVHKRVRRKDFSTAKTT